jgi:FAD:protein FMN transferase
LQQLPGIRRVEHVMGMPVVADVRDDGVDESVLDDVLGWLRWVDEVFSTYKQESEVSRIGRGALDVADAHPDVQAVLARCEELREETGGYFDARAGGADTLDPSGLVKGWSVDRAAAILESAGVRNFALNAGGDMRLRGRAAPAWCWRVGIQHPRLDDAVAWVLETADLAVATSGEYARGHHVLDPHTHRPPRGILSVTVTGPDLATADAYATAAFAMGDPRALHWTARLVGYEALTILADGRVLSTPGFPASAPQAAA